MIMPRDYVIGIDNGVTGTICVLTGDGRFISWHKTPTFDYTDYSKRGRVMRRIQKEELALILAPYVQTNMKVFLEYPFTGNGDSMFNRAIFSAGWSFGDTVDVMEKLKIGFEVLPAVRWQQVMLPDVKGRMQLKKASRDRAKMLFPKLVLPAGEDGDAVLMSEYCRRSGL